MTLTNGRASTWLLVIKRLKNTNAVESRISLYRKVVKWWDMKFWGGKVSGPALNLGKKWSEIIGIVMRRQSLTLVYYLRWLRARGTVGKTAFKYSVPGNWPWDIRMMEKMLVTWYTYTSTSKKHLAANKPLEKKGWNLYIDQHPRCTLVEPEWVVSLRRLPVRDVTPRSLHFALEVDCGHRTENIMLRRLLIKCGQ